MADLKVDDMTKFAKDALYVTVGLGVIAFQKAQVQRHELTKQFRGQVDRHEVAARGLLELPRRPGQDRRGAPRRRRGPRRGPARPVEDRLPEQAREVAQQLRKAAKDARGQLRELVSRSNGSPTS